MSVFYARNLTNTAIAVRENGHSIISFARSGDEGDRKPVSMIALQRADIQSLWADGRIAVFADDDYETLVQFKSFRNLEELRNTLGDAKLASIVTDPTNAVNAAVAATGGAGTGLSFDTDPDGTPVLVVG